MKLSCLLTSFFIFTALTAQSVVDFSYQGQAGDVHDYSHAEVISFTVDQQVLNWDTKAAFKRLGKLKLELVQVMPGGELVVEATNSLEGDKRLTYTLTRKGEVTAILDEDGDDLEEEWPLLTYPTEEIQVNVPWQSKGDEELWELTFAFEKENFFVVEGKLIDNQFFTEGFANELSELLKEFSGEADISITFRGIEGSMRSEICSKTHWPNEVYFNRQLHIQVTVNDENIDFTLPVTVKIEEAYLKEGSF
ncbi:MAG: hypothetical protein WDZ28_00220 [Simkaniaceae bacterium]